jgi:hypothetical protein
MTGKRACSHRNKADLLALSLEAPGNLPIALIQAEIERLTKCCEAEAEERQICEYFGDCSACVLALSRLGPAEVARRLAQR